ncbi:hypothetical protein HDU87_008260 [Geranomyces variabilis]|uniref:Uncharacterized protein n=1 Tax=Geranomyces variabilis TaxID=109894 RepID=A0AAD5TDF2_9FUNG|nr:hypothetical protein HDU87_008260 [Geranomyces variabilis]
MEMERSLSLLQDKCADAMAEDDDAGAEADLLKLQAFFKEFCGSKDSPLVKFIDRVVERLKVDRLGAHAACDPVGDEDEESHEEEAEDVDLGIVRHRRADAAEGRQEKRRKMDAIAIYNGLMREQHPVISELLHEWFCTSYTISMADSYGNEPMTVGDLVSEARHCARHMKQTQSTKLWGVINLVVMCKFWQRKGDNKEERACLSAEREDTKRTIQASGWASYEGFIRALKYTKQPLRMAHLNTIGEKKDQILALVNKEDSEWAVPCQVYDKHIADIVDARFNFDTVTYEASRLALIQEMDRVREEQQQEISHDQERIIDAKSEALAAYKLQVTMAKQLGKKEIAAERRLNLLKDRLRATNQELGELRGTVSNRTKLGSVSRCSLGMRPFNAKLQEIIKFDRGGGGYCEARVTLTRVHGCEFAVIRELYLEFGIPFNDVQEEMDAELDAIKTAENSEAEDGGADI